jgi:hypothetical protein
LETSVFEVLHFTSKSFVPQQSHVEKIVAIFPPASDSRRRRPRKRKKKRVQMATWRLEGDISNKAKKFERTVGQFLNSSKSPDAITIARILKQLQKVHSRRM